MGSSGKDILKRLGLTAIGQMLPPASALSVILKDIRRGLFASIVGGVLLSGLLLLGCFAFYQFLVSEGLSVVLSGSLCAFVLFLLVVIFMLVANQSFSRVAESEKLLSPTQGSQLPALSIDALIQSFWDGFCDNEATVKEQVEPFPQLKQNTYKVKYDDQ